MTRVNSQENPLAGIGVDISERGLLVSLKITKFSNSTIDAKVGKEIATIKNVQTTAEKAGRYSKKLLPNKGALQRINAIASSARTNFSAHTLPWADGERVIAADLYPDLINLLAHQEKNFWEAVEAFKNEYPALCENAKNQLGDLYNPGDYPDISSLVDAFEFSYSTKPITKVSDFRVDIGDDIKKIIAARFEAANAAAVAEGRAEIQKRLNASLSAISELLSDKSKRIHKSTIDGLGEIVRNARHNNLTKDQNLEQLLCDIEDKITTQPVAALRQNNSARSDVAAQAKALLEQTQNIFGNGGVA